MAVMHRLREISGDILKKLPSSREDAIAVYVPTFGAISYSVFALNIMEHARFKRLFAPNELLVANTLWLNAHLGIGFFIYSRRHLADSPVYKRIIYSAFGTIAFNFGSVLLWASLKSLLPNSTGLRVLFGLLSSWGLLYVGKDYLDHVDTHVPSIPVDSITTLEE
ncbi:uncharacterized protein LOC106881286 [Octopus bimaculoides]|uniref:Uncharacterized protein n=1 Tax=Octopus bimaculoides TaxID=37653 RepID=A0A0L8FTA3_OCTBM|nr:uncharacterized protein LOC106881286 [Octopus bimaculoides]|eukprot:XP_014787104.1 PREDICTED: uncharacterized protein LOC106881286 [Octopus bimaculoides]